MKRIISVLTVLVMLFALVSCGAESSGEATPTPEPTQQATPTDTPSPTPVKGFWNSQTNYLISMASASQLENF